MYNSSPRLRKKPTSKTIFILVISAFLLLLLLVLSSTARELLQIDTLVSQLSPSQTSPLQVPVLQPLPNHTNQDKISIAGTASPRTKVILLHNDAESLESESSKDGQFEFAVALEEGENTFSAYAVGPDGEETKLSKHHTVFRDKTGPDFTISEPTMNQVFETENHRIIAIKGNAEPSAKVSLNGKLIFVNSKGEFTSSLGLENGENTLLFEASDLAGNTYKQEIKVRFKP